MDTGGFLEMLFDCNFKMPKSATPTTFTFKFKKGNFLRMKNTVILQAMPSPLPSAQFTADSKEMLANTTYYVTIHTSEGLGQYPGFYI